MSKENNFTIIRWIAAGFVFAGHMGVILGGDAPRLGVIDLDKVGVSILFLISGYLITMSWLADPDPVNFAIRRFFRFLPPFAVVVLLAAFVAGPLLTELGRTAYFQSTYLDYLRNLLFYPVYYLPGVFEHLPVAYTVNGSLWTMPVEAALYVVTPILLSIFRVKGHSVRSLRVLAALAGVGLVVEGLVRTFADGTMTVFYGTDLVSAFHLVLFYLIGILFTYEEVRKFLHLQVAGIAMAAVLMLQHLPEGLYYPLWYLILAYFVFSMAFAPQPVFSRLGRKLEPSYGVYLYGFFFQQLVVYLQLKRGVVPGYLDSFVLAGIPTLAAAILSYYLIEKPCIRFGRFLIAKRRKSRTESKV